MPNSNYLLINFCTTKNLFCYVFYVFFYSFLFKVRPPCAVVSVVNITLIFESCYNQANELFLLLLFSLFVLLNLLIFFLFVYVFKIFYLYEIKYSLVKKMFAKLRENFLIGTLFKKRGYTCTLYTTHLITCA